MTKKKIILLSVIIGCLCLPGYRAYLVSDEPSNTLEKQIKEAIAQLSDEDWEVREKATQTLWAIGKPAEGALKEALKSVDPEDRMRANYLLENFKYGITLDTPEDIVKLIQTYRSGNEQAKMEVVGQLLGRHINSVLYNLINAEENPPIRQMILERFSTQIADFVPLFLSMGDTAAAEDALEKGLERDSDENIKYYCAYYLSRGKIEEKINFLKTKFDSSRNIKIAKAIAYLYRAKGDWEKADAFALESGDENLRLTILREGGNWKKLAELQSAQPFDENNIGQLGYRAALHRLAGNTEEFKKIIDRIVKLAPPMEEDDTSIHYRAEALILNGCFAEAMKLYQDNKAYEALFDFYISQLRFKEAFELVKKAVEDKLPDSYKLESNMIITIYSLGDQKRALELMAGLRDKYKNATDIKVIDALIESELSLGRKDEALQLCMDNIGYYGENPYPVFRVFPGWKLGNVRAWYAFLRQKFPDEAVKKTIERLNEIDGQKANKEDLRGLCGQMEQMSSNCESSTRLEWLQSAGQSYFKLGATDSALACFEEVYHESGSNYYTTAFIADLLAREKLWKQAARYYHRAWDLNQSNYQYLWQEGYALVQSGEKEKGEKLMKDVCSSPVLSNEARYILVFSLNEHGLEDEAERQQQFILQTGGQGFWGFNYAFAVLAEKAAARKDFGRAVLLCEQYLLNELSDSGTVLSPKYFIFQRFFHTKNQILKSLLLDKKREIKDVMKEVEVCISIMPGNLDLPLAVVPELEKLGYKKEADEVFYSVFNHIENVLKDYPGSTEYLNQLAWLCARTHRELDKALAYALKAAELKPDNVAYLDTLAEVYFRKGDKDKAIELEKKCIGLAPEMSFFKEQLERFQSPPDEPEKR
jgi:tetratricopeptide (TPR) repeat protein